MGLVEVEAVVEPVPLVLRLLGPLPLGLKLTVLHWDTDFEGLNVTDAVLQEVGGALAVTHSEAETETVEHSVGEGVPLNAVLGLTEGEIVEVCEPPKEGDTLTEPQVDTDVEKVTL